MIFFTNYPPHLTELISLMLCRKKVNLSFLSIFFTIDFQLKQRSIEYFFLFSIDFWQLFAGVRLLCFVGQQTMACSLLSTLLFGAVSWRREDATYPSLLLLVIGFECLSFGRVRELAVKLGGTCAAYALITPTTTVK